MRLIRLLKLNNVNNIKEDKMNINYKFILIVVVSFIAINHIAFGQSNEDVVQHGINQYQNGNYEEAISLFDTAISNTKSKESDVPLAEVSDESDINVSKETDVQVSKETYVGVSTEETVSVSETQLTGVNTEKYISDPLNYEGSDLGKIYFYRGRANMQLGNKEEAFQDFDKAVQLNPSYSEAYFRRAIASHHLDKENVCEDLKKAMESEHSSAETLFNSLCN